MIDGEMPADVLPFERPVRPAKCWCCGQQMFYVGDKEYEQEVRLTVEHDSTSHETIYIHTRCWNDWQQRRRGDEEYEAGYAHGQQARIGSLIESLMNVAIGYGVALLSQIAIFPMRESLPGLVRLTAMLGHTGPERDDDD